MLYRARLALAASLHGLADRLDPHAFCDQCWTNMEGALVDEVWDVPGAYADVVGAVLASVVTIDAPLMERVASRRLLDPSATWRTLH